jgi:hypothetical protein
MHSAPCICQGQTQVETTSTKAGDALNGKDRTVLYKGHDLSVRTVDESTALRQRFARTTAAIAAAAAQVQVQEERKAKEA